MARDLPGATASWRRLAHTLASHTSRRACANHHQSAAGAASATILRSARGPLRSTARWRLERGGPSRASLPCLPGGRRYYSGGGYGGSPNWDGLVYSIMTNLRGQVQHGPECFYASTSDAVDNAERDKHKRRDIRDLVPLRLNRPLLLSIARDLKVRLALLCKAEAHTADHLAVQNLIRLVERLGRMDDENPRLEHAEYLEIWTTIRDGVQGANDMPLQTISINEGEELKKLRWTAEVVWGVACLNAAVRNLPGEAVEVAGQDGGPVREAWKGDLRALSFKILGLVLDSKDFFPEGDKWFGTEQEEAILEVVGRVWNEASRRSDL